MNDTGNDSTHRGHFFRLNQMGLRGLEFSEQVFQLPVFVLELLVLCLRDFGFLLGFLNGVADLKVP